MEEAVKREEGVGMRCVVYNLINYREEGRERGVYGDTIVNFHYFRTLPFSGIFWTLKGRIEKTKGLEKTTI